MLRGIRVLAFCLILLGAIVGGWIIRLTGDIAPVLWLVAGIKTAVAGSGFLEERDPMVSFLDHCALLRKECVVFNLGYQLVYQDVARILSV